jgi:hypothetical protein
MEVANAQMASTGLHAQKVGQNELGKNIWAFQNVHPVDLARIVCEFVNAKMGQIVNLQMENAFAHRVSFGIILNIYFDEKILKMRKVFNCSKVYNKRMRI